MSRNATAAVTYTITFSANVERDVTAAARLAHIALRDDTVEVGLYNRMAYTTDLNGWDAVAVVLTAVRDVATGTRRRSLTAALDRIPTIAKEEAAEARREAARAARAERRAARAARRAAAN